MIKLIAIGMWVCAVTLGSVYYSVYSATRPEAAEELPPLLGGLETIRGDIITVPVIADGDVQGYFLTRLSFTAVPAEVAKLSVPPGEMITDALYSELVGSKAIDFGNLDSFDLAAFKANIKTALNDRIGQEIFHDVIVEQIDFLSKEDIRANMRKGSQSLKGVAQPIGEGDGATAPVH